MASHNILVLKYHRVVHVSRDSQGMLILCVILNKNSILLTTCYQISYLMTDEPKGIHGKHNNYCGKFSLVQNLVELPSNPSDINANFTHALW